MSSTNKTTYYELPQYTENDIFNPLADDNDAYEKIDTALHNIANAEADDASEIIGIKSRLDSAEGDIDAIEAQNGNSVLTTTAQTLSGAINELNSDISSLDGRLDIVEDEINNANTGLKAKVASDELKISALETQNGNTPLTTSAQTISGAINELKGRNDTTDTELSNIDLSLSNINSLLNPIVLSSRKFLFVGDSYIAAHSNTCVEYACAKLGITNYENISVVGAAMSFDSLAGSFKGQLVNYDGSMARDAITDIFVIGGLNDAVQPANYTGAGAIISGMEEFVDYANQEYPNANITICFAGCAKENANLDGREFINRSWARLAYSRFSQSRKVKLHTELCYCLAMPSALGSDGMHPSEGGQRIMSNALVNYILGNDYRAITPYQPYVFTGTVNAARALFDGDNVTLSINSQILFDLSDGSYDGYSQIEIATLDGIYVNRPVNIPASLMISNTGGGSHYPCPNGRLVLDGNKLKFSAMSYTSAGLQSLTFSSSKLIIQPTSVTFPTSLLI